MPFQATSAPPWRRAALKSSGRPNTTSPLDYSRGFGLSFPLFARRYSGDLILISLPPPTWMFPFGRFALLAKPRAKEAFGLLHEYTFGDPEIDACMRLPRAFRSLPRPSSPPKPSHPPCGVVVFPLRWSWRPLHGGNRAHALRPSPISAALTGCIYLERGPLQAGRIKEVILPHVPVRQPCYDLAPLARPWFDATNRAAPHQDLTRVARRAVCARGRDVFTAR